MTREYESVDVVEIRTFEIPAYNAQRTFVNAGEAAALAENQAGEGWGGAQVKYIEKNGDKHKAYYRVKVRHRERGHVRVN